MTRAIRAFTPESASPEQIRSEPVTVTSDVYSLGALLYRLLTDQKVFDFSSSNESEIVKTICEREPVAAERGGVSASANASIAIWIGS